MIRLLARLAAIAAFAAAPAWAFAPAAPKVSVTFPAGWRMLERDGLTSVRHPSDHARCNSDVTRIPAHDALPQAELNGQLTAPWGAAEWAAFLGAPASKVELVSTGTRAAGPYQVRTGTLLIRAGATRVTRQDVYGHVAVLLTPGYAVIAACYAPVRHYPAQRAGMEAAVGTLRVE